MISLVRKLCLALMLFFLFLIGIYALSGNSFSPDFLKEFLSSLYYFFLWHDSSRILFWSLLTLLPVFYIFLSVRAWSAKEKYVIKGKDGNSVISQRAILRSLISAVRTVPNVIRVRPIIKSELGGLNVKLIAFIKLEQYIPNLCDHIRSRAKSALTDVLGIDRITRIDIHIEEVKIRRPPLAERIKREAPASKESAPARQPAPEASPRSQAKPVFAKPETSQPQAQKNPAPPLSRNPSQPEKKP